MELEYKTFNAEDGAEIKYIDVGEGKPFFYFYGMGSSIESQKLFIECLVKNFRCIVLDQRAYGKTAETDKDSIPRAARDGKALLDYLKIDKTVMMGYSMGGAVIFSYVQQFGCDRIEKILIGDMTPKIINEDGWNLGLYQGHYTREMFEQDLYYMGLDTPPHCPTFIMMAAICGVTTKASYKHVFVLTVITPIVLAAIACVFAMVGIV